MVWCRTSRLFGAAALLLSLSAAPLAAAQTPSTQATKPVVEPQARFGSVAGHVSFAGNNAPVRFADVALQPIDVKAASTTPGKGSPASFSIYETDLSGDFHIDHVTPGVYYVVVKYPGSLSPFASFTQAELEHPTEQVAAKIAATIPTISVRGDTSATVNISLQTGASLSGVARFDDGTPYVGGFLSIERRGSDGKWAAPRAVDANANTDSGGRWEFGGLPPGEYRVHVNLLVQDRKQTSLLGENGSSWSSFKFSVAVYMGDTTRERDAKTVTLAEGQSADGQTVTIPVSRMHTIAGAIVDARTGQALNAGTVSLAFSDDGKDLCSANIDPESRSFSIPFVMEGSYKLSVGNPREVRIEITPEPEGTFGSPQQKETLVRAYAPGNLPLVVQSDVSSVSLPVDPMPAKAK